MDAWLPAATLHDAFTAAAPAAPAPARRPRAYPAAVAPPSTPEPDVQVSVAARGPWFVQAGAYSTRERANAVAKALRARVVPGGGLWRVRLTGLASAAEAKVAELSQSLDAARAGRGHALDRT